MRLIDADALLRHKVEADRMGAMLVVGIGHIFSAQTVSPWVKTADRLPTKADGEILAINKYGLNLLPYYRVVELSDVYMWWMPIPPLPEVEG